MAGYRNYDWVRWEIRRAEKPPPTYARLWWCAAVCTGMCAYFLLMGGCAAHNTQCLSDSAQLSDAPAARSVLIGGAGLDPVATAITRDPWPAAYRDEFDGEQGSYIEYYNDVQQTQPGPYWYGYGGYTTRQFHSYKIGGFRR